MKKGISSFVKKLFLTLIILVGMLPMTAFAAKSSGEIEVKIQGMHNAQIKYAKLYTYDDKEEKTKDLLEEINGDSGSYTLNLQEGDYWLDGYDANDDLNGGIKLTVSENQNTFYIQRVYAIYCSNKGWTEGTNYEISVAVSNGSVNRETTLGKANYLGNTRTSCLFIKGDTIAATFTPIGEYKDSYYAETIRKTAMMNCDISGKVNEAVKLTFTVPKGSVVDVGKTLKNNYYTQNFYEASGTPAAGENDTEIWTYRIPKETSNKTNGPYHFFRVQHEEGVTYWDFFDPSAITDGTKEFTITKEDLFIGSKEFTKDTVIKDYSENKHDTAGIYMNINAQGYKSMKKGETYELNMFRNWQAIEHFYNRMIALPDMSYEIITVDGTDVISIEPDEKNSSIATMTAKNEGTAIVLVTYDAMFSAQAMTDYDAKAYYNNSKFSAIWPELTGVFVVTVDKDGTGIDTGMEIDRQGKTGTIDAEHDILYYFGEEGASYSFKPENGTTVTVNRGTSNGEKWSFAGFSAADITTAEDGTVTVSGLKTGRHIIKVAKADGTAAYQVVTVRQASYELLDENFNALTEESEIKANDIIYVQFSGLINPCEKLAGIYNHAAIIQYLSEDGNKCTSSPGGVYGVYDFSSDATEQRVKVQIPKYWTGTTYSLNSGVINMKTSGSAPTAHRNLRYVTGSAANYDAAQGIGTLLCEIPDIEIPLTETEFLTGSISFEDEAGKSIDRSNVTITLEDTDGNSVELTEESKFQCLEGTYHYTVKAAGYFYKTGSIEVSNDNLEFTITLKVSSENAWDGMTLKEPSTEEGVYQIGTGAELAWFADYVNRGNGTTSAVLTADIHLAGYEWTPIGNSSKQFTGNFDGQNHKIEYLKISNIKGYAGVFGYVNSNGVVKNLTAKGEITLSSSGTSAGGIVGYVNSATIENCINNVKITNVGNNTGGIAGNSYASKIIGCKNTEAITSTSSYAGGIVGNLSSSVTKAVIQNCCNSGKVTAKTYAGGLVGYSGGAQIIGSYNSGAVESSDYAGGLAGYLIGSAYAFSGGTAELKACYNTGTVKAPSNAGGLLGKAGYMEMNDCYSIGAVTGTSTISGAIGALNDTNISGANVYYLDTSAESSAAEELCTAKTSEELKVAELDSEYYGGTCKGYPALLWQKDVTFHKLPETGVVTKPTCTEKGYTAYTCENCQESYRKEFTDALGHDWCDHESLDSNCTDCVQTAPTCIKEGSLVRTCKRDGCEETKEDVLAATGHTEDPEKTVDHTIYKDCVCKTCAETYRIWSDERLQYMTIDTDAVSDISLTDEGEELWDYQKTKKRFENSNSTKFGTTAKTTLKFTLTSDAKVSFNYGIESLTTTYDTMNITVNDETIATYQLPSNEISNGKAEAAYEKILPAGEHTITFTYQINTAFWGSTMGVGYFKDLSIQGVKSESSDAKVTVYLNVTKDSKFVTKKDTVMALTELNVPYFDLAAYGLQNLYYNPDCYQGTQEEQKPGTAETAKHQVTMLHAMIYATEVYCYDVAEAEAGKGYLKTNVWDKKDENSMFDISGDAGSSYITDFWGFGTNMNYYLNYEYPLGRPGWGATCDQILLKEQDIISIRYNPYTGTDDGTFYHFGESGDFSYTVPKGSSLTLKLYETVGNSSTYETEHTLAGEGNKIYLTSQVPGSLTEETPVGTTNAKGEVTIDTASLQAGTYYVTTASHDPAVAILKIQEAELSAEKGDANGDGKINATDASMILRYAAGLLEDASFDRTAADVNGDGTVNATDASLILRYAAGLIQEFSTAQ